ncbi:MAG: pilus assembly protein PilM [Candidatus Omnitrophica bacterium]|nr:pilus assembly protein PilM [Candidatus Omnitrophota bacterium]
MDINFKPLRDGCCKVLDDANRLAWRFFPKKIVDPRITVCDIGRSKTVLLELLKNSDHLFINRFEIIHNSFQEQKPSLVLKPYFDGKRFQRERIRVALKGHGVVIRFIRFPKMKFEDLASALKYEAEQYIPFELSDVVFDFAVVEDHIKTDEGEKMEVMLAVIKRQQLESTLEIFRNMECQLAVVDVDVLTAMAALEYFHPEDFSGHIAILDLGTEISTLGVVRDGKPRFIRGISYGSYDLQKRLKTRSNLSDEMIRLFFEKNTVPTPEAEQALVESLEGLIGDLRVSFDYYYDQTPNVKPIDKLYLCGGASQPPVLKALSAGLQIPVCCMDVMKKVRFAPEVDESQFKAALPLLPVALGLGVREA